MQSWIITQTIDLTRGGGTQAFPDALMCVGDSGAHIWRVRVLQGGLPADLSASAAEALIVRADGTTVSVQAAIAEDTIDARLSADCYAVAGELRAVMRLRSSDALISIAAAQFRVLDWPGAQEE